MGRGVPQAESTGDDHRGSNGLRWAASGLLCAVLVFSPLELPWGALSGTAQEGGLLNFSKVFTDDPVRQGDSTVLTFTIDNTSAGPVTDLAFTDDLDAAMLGLSATGPPVVNPCGPGSSLLGSMQLIFSGGSLDPGSSCTFNVGLQVPSGAPFGNYMNTTSPITSSLGTGDTASASLSVSLFNFLPFDQPDADFYSFEVSDLDVYNFERQGAAGMTIAGGPNRDRDRRGLDPNDVLKITGMGDESFGVVTPQRTARFYSPSSNPFPNLQRPLVLTVTIGVFVDGDGENLNPVVDGIVVGQTFGGVSIDEVVGDGADRLVFGCGAIPTFDSTNPRDQLT